VSGITTRAPTAPPPDIQRYPPVSNRLELLDLLITGQKGTHRETFFQKMQSILDRTPRIGTTSRPEFFTYRIVGALTVLPYTQLMSRLHIQQIYIKPISHLTVKAAFRLGTKEGKALRLYTFTAIKKIQKEQHWKQQELKELISILNITQNILPNYEVNQELQVSGKIYQMDPSFILHEKDIEIVPSDQSGDLKDLKEMFLRSVPEQPLPTESPEKRRVFKEVKRTVNLKDAQSADIENLEPLFNELPRYCNNLEEMDDAQKEEALKAVAEEVETAASNIIQNGLFPIYKSWEKELQMVKYEVYSHGYVTGVLEHLFKYRYALDIAVEKNLGLGRADLTFVSRLDGLDNKNWNAIPNCIEFKIGEHSSRSPDQGLQQITQQGYLRITPRMRTLARQGVGLGVNFDFTPPVKSQTIQVKVEPINFVETLLEQGNREIANVGLPATNQDVQDTHRDVLEKLKEGLLDIDYSIIRQNGSPDNSNYFRNFLLGQAMGFTGPDCSTYAVFEQGIPNLSLFLVQENGVVILTVNAAHMLSEHEAKAEFLRQEEILQGNEPYFALTVDVDHKSTPTLKDSVSSNFNPNELIYKDFSYKEIEPFEFIEIKEDDDDSASEPEVNLAHESVASQLAGFRNNSLEIIERESDMQALWQGGLLAGGEQVYTESNHVLGKRADLVILTKEEGDLMVFELKAAEDSEEANELQEDAITQVRKLIGNLKSFTDKRTVDLGAMTYDPEKNIFMYNKWPEEVAHTSQGPDSPKKSIDSDSPTKRKSPESDSDSEQETPPAIPIPAGGFSLARWLGGLFAGIVGGLGALLAAGSFAAIRAAVSNILLNIRNLMRIWTPDLLGHTREAYQTYRTLEEAQDLMNRMEESDFDGEIDDATREEIERLEREFENNPYLNNAQRIEEVITNEVRQRRLEKKENERKKPRDPEDPGPSHSKRSVLSPIPEEDEWPAEGMISHEGDNCTSSGIVGETVPNKLFSLCRIQFQSEKDWYESDRERMELDCYLEIDYQNKDSVLIDVSLWDLGNKTMSYNPSRDEVTLLLPLLKGEKKLILADASRVYYKLVDIRANICTPPLNETQTCLPVNQNETSTEELEEATLTTPVHLIEIEEKENKVEIANCSRIELSASHNESYVEGDEVINPMLNSIDVIEIGPLHERPCFVNLSDWNLLQSGIEYRGANNTLTIAVKDNDAIGTKPFQVELRDYLPREGNSTPYQLSDKIFEQITLVFTPRNDQVLQRITSFQIKNSIPETVLNQKGDRASNVLAWYKNSTQTEAGIEVLYGEVVDPAPTILQKVHLRHSPTTFLQVPVNPRLRGFGSKFNDKIWVYDDFIYVYGGEGKDCYLVEPNRSGGIKTTFINNDAKNETQDYLVLPVPFQALAIGLYHNNSVQFFSTQREFGRKMVLANYCKDANKQHLAVLTKDGCLIELPGCESLAKYPQRISTFFREDATASADICNVTMETVCKETIERNHRNPVRTKRAVNDRVKVEKQDKRIFKPIREQSFLKPLGITSRVGVKEVAEKSPSVQPRYDVTAYENVPFIKWLSYLFGRRSFVERMNKAEQAGFLYEDDQNSNLYWAEKRLKEGIALYGAEEED